MIEIQSIQCPNCGAKLEEEEAKHLVEGVPTKCRYCGDIMMLEPKIVPKRKKIVTDIPKIKPLRVPTDLPKIKPLKPRKKKRLGRWETAKTWYYYAGPSSSARWKKGI